MPKVRGSDQERQAVTVQERWQRGASPRPRSGVAAERNHPSPEVRGPAREEPLQLRGAAAARRRAERSYSTFKVRRGGGEKIPLVQGEGKRLRFAGAAVKRYPMSKVRETQVRRQVLREGIRGQRH